MFSSSLIVISTIYNVNNFVADEDENAKRLPPPPPIKTMTYTVSKRLILTTEVVVSP